MTKVDPGNCVNMEEAIRYLGYKREKPDENIMKELIKCTDSMLQVIRPKFLYEIFELYGSNNELFVGKERAIRLEGNAIKRHLEGCEYVALCCATLASGMDQLIDQKQKENMLHALLLDALANAAIEEVRKQLEATLAAEYLKYTTTWLFGIGYGDSSLLLQQDLLTLIQAQKKLGVTVNSSSILIPQKSISGFIGLSTTNRKICRETYCKNCNLLNHCQYRRG